MIHFVSFKSVEPVEPIRFYRSDFWERLTHVKMWQIVVVWLGLGIFFTTVSMYVAGSLGYTLGFSLFALVVTFLIGFVRWSIIEYLLHRFLFHYKGEKPVLRKMAWMLHGVHHKQPTVSVRLFTPFGFSLAFGVVRGFLDWSLWHVLPQALGFAGLGYIGAGLFAGTCFGLLYYDLSHWSYHFLDINLPWFRKLQEYHQKHHENENHSFDISLRLWDPIFKTDPKGFRNKRGKDSEHDEIDYDVASENQ